MAENTNAVLKTSYSATNVGSNAYTVITPAGGTVVSFARIQVTDTSGHLVILAYGPTGAEVQFATCAVSGSVIIPVFFPLGTQIQIKAVDISSITTGYNVVSLLGW